MNNKTKGQAFYLDGISDELGYIPLEAFNAGGGTLKRWTGAIWTPSLLKNYNGSSWDTSVLKRWNGSEWTLVSTAG